MSALRLASCVIRHRFAERSPRAAIADAGREGREEGASEGAVVERDYALSVAPSHHRRTRRCALFRFGKLTSRDYCDHM